MKIQRQRRVLLREVRVGEIRIEQVPDGYFSRATLLSGEVRKGYIVERKRR